MALTLWSSFTALNLLHSGLELCNICSPCAWLLTKHLDFKMKKNRKTYFPEEVVLNRAEWKSQAEIQPTVSQTHTKKFLVWKTLFKIASKVSLVTDLQLGATSSLLLSKIKSVDKSHIICLFIFEINRKILLVIKRRGSATVLVISVTNTFTHCWCGPPMLCVRLHSCHVQSVQYK